MTQKLWIESKPLRDWSEILDSCLLSHNKCTDLSRFLMLKKIIKKTVKVFRKCISMQSQYFLGKLSYSLWP